MNEFFIYNDTFYRVGVPVISTQNRSLRYGDGIFETIKMVNGIIINKEYHFERLFNGLSILKFDISKSFTQIFLEKKIDKLVLKNHHEKEIRIRLTVFRNEGSLFDIENLRPSYIIESWQLDNQTQLNENGLTVDVFEDVKKSCDNFSRLKSNNYLPSVMTALYAKQNKLNDCIMLNCFDKVCESAIANIFIIKQKKIFTPPLSDGCVAGTMRRWMIEKFSLKNYPVIEKSLSVNDLLHADELFLTNSIYYLRWVKSFKEKRYTNTIGKEIFNHVLATIQ